MAVKDFSDLSPTDVSMDDKGRIAIPTAYVRQLRTFFDDPNELTVHLTISTDGCIVAYPPEEWKAFSAQLQRDMKANRRDRQLQRESRRIISAASPVTLDKQNRVKLPDVLCKYAKIAKAGSVTVAGLMENFEIWDSAAYQAFLDDDSSGE